MSAQLWFTEPDASSILALPIGGNMCEKCEKAKSIIQEWSEKQGHDRCWYYPDLFNQLVELFGMELKSGCLPPRAEFESGCRRYQDEEYAEIDQQPIIEFHI